MAFIDLTAQEQQELSEWLDNFARPLAGKYAQWLNSAKATKDRHDAGIDNILAQLVGVDAIPNTSGLGAAQEITKTQLNTVLSLMNTNLTNDDIAATRQILIAFAGINALGN